MLGVSTDVLMSYEDFLIALLSGENNNGEISENLIGEIQSLPDGNFVLHGNYHPGNIMAAADGKPVIIDLLNVCCGPQEYGVARTFFLLEHKKWQDKYLKEMGYCREDIEGYLKMIRAIRKYE